MYDCGIVVLNGDFDIVFELCFLGNLNDVLIKVYLCGY